jgi:hypothetical protein
VAEQIGYVVWMDVRRAESGGERMSKIVKVKVRQAGPFDGCLKACHQLPAFPACALRVKDKLIICRILHELHSSFVINSHKYTLLPLCVRYDVGDEDSGLMVDEAGLIDPL